MVIEIKQPENEMWKPTLTVKGLTEGDYVVLSIDRMHKEFNGEYGKSYLCFVDVFEYSAFDAKQRKVIDKSFEEAERCSWFASEALYNKIVAAAEEGEAVKIFMKELEGGKSTYVVEKFSFSSSQKTDQGNKSNKEIEDVWDKGVYTSNEDIKATLTDDVKKDLIDALKEFKKLNMPEDIVVSSLKDKFPEESIKELYRL